MRLSLDSRFHTGSPEIDAEFRPGQLLTSPIAKASLGAARLIANVFDGGPKTKVVMRIGDRPPLPMARQTMADPFVEELFARNPTMKKPWVKAEVSSHIWSARLPADLPAGAHRLVVEAKTEYGDVVSGRLALEIVG